MNLLSELSRSPLKAFTPILALLVVLAAFSVELTGVRSWLILAQADAATAVLVAPLAAGLAFISSSTRFTSDLRRRLAGSERVPVAVSLHFAATLAWIISGFVAGSVLYFLIHILLAAPLGYFPTLWFLSTAAGITSASSVGYALGCIIGPGRMWAAPVVAFTVYLGFLPINTLLMGGSAWVRQLYFFTDQRVAIFTEVSTPLLSGQILWHLGIGLLLLLCVIITLSTVRLGGVRILQVAALGSAIAGCLVVAPTQGRLAAGSVDADQSCFAVGQARSCVAEAYDASVPAVRETFSGLLNKLPELNDPKMLFLQRGLRGPASTDVKVGTFDLYDASLGSGAGARASFVQGYIGSGACSVAEAALSQEVVAAWLEDRANPFPTDAAEPRLVSAAEAFYSKSEAARSTWLMRHLTALRQCDVTYSDLARL